MAVDVPRNYLVMRPIINELQQTQQQSSSNSPLLPSSILKGSRSCERIFSEDVFNNNNNNNNNSSSKSMQNAFYQPLSGSSRYLGDYVKMAKRTSTAAPTTPIASFAGESKRYEREAPPSVQHAHTTRKKPLPMPRSTATTTQKAAYQHIDDDGAQTSTTSDGERSCSTTPTNFIRCRSAATTSVPMPPQRYHSHRRHQHHQQQHQQHHQHSPTPDFPPPTVSQAENAIFSFMQAPSNATGKLPQHLPSTTTTTMPAAITQDHQQARPDFEDDKDFENIAFIWENVSSSHDESHSSRASDYYVEQFVGSGPFAGLFKGSTLTLNANSSESDHQRNDDGSTANTTAIALEHRDGLRSPSLVRAVKAIVTVPSKQRNPDYRHKHVAPINVSTEEISVSKEWEEIDTILESIGSETTSPIAVTSASMTNGVVVPPLEEGIVVGGGEEEIKIRQPADLALTASTDGDGGGEGGGGDGTGVGNTSDSYAKTNWCHSPNRLIHSHILYTVYYLGSTVIRELRGTLSTRKSIQKLKLDEAALLQQEAPEATLLENCNNSTKILKANNHQTRLQVGISLSHVGVRFIDAENGATMCVHEIENINCVCQDKEDMRYFAYITKEQDIYYCHVFMVDNEELASEVVMTLAEAFEVAYQLAMRQQDEMSASMTSSTSVANNCIPIANI